MSELICDYPKCNGTASLFRHKDEEGGTWKWISRWKETAAKDGMLHACSNEHAELIDCSHDEN
jgi:hypothetical protein